MKIVSTDGYFHAYDFPLDVVVAPGRIMALLARHIKPDGSIDDLCLDFCGSYVPIAHESELRLVCALVGTYANTHEARFNEVSLPARPACQCARHAQQPPACQCARNAQLAAPAH